MSFYKEVPGRQTTLESTLKFDTAPTAGSTNPVTSGGVANAVTDILDDHATTPEDEELTMPTAEAVSYTVGNYFEQDGEIWKVTSKTDNGNGTWTVKADKVNGVVPALNSPNIKNVQPDWTATSGYTAIKNKPFYRKYTESSSYYKVCTMPKLGASSAEMYGFEILARKYNGGIYGTLLYKNTLKLILNSVSNVSIDADYIRLYALVGDSTVTIYARALGYVSLQAAPLINLPKSNVDFTDFGTAVSGLPEGATEINSVWSASSTGSSGDIPVKVNEYGLLSAVTMDNYPTKNSTSLVNSGKMYDVFTGDNGDQMTEAPPQQVYVTGKFYFVAGKVCRCTAYSAASATFDMYGVVEAMNYILGQI